MFKILNRRHSKNIEQNQCYSCVNSQNVLEVGGVRNPEGAGRNRIKENSSA